ncbi:MAG: spore coat U domain-containing protein [Gammaproteobacteria bacterium]|nr:spore coat U domain-containing protein [Gammaproteobacteria bacterium]MBU2066994.1 spore coat U domain-containing protein [Gammaproteobacteria bacterium]MBU2138967.1 spore coat U domain-containing protein [Gammaproteobacteria bacterium]MBU2216312.1 spore coat U domain-containing protein [Gammaproteobacteria bacterium]MBU2322818.1 spore coat U domain-containing protein [Gammaproteobacteria bacterium]
MKLRLIRSIALLALASATGTALAAGQLQGQLNVQMVIGSGCTVTNGSDDGSSNTFGSILFGEYPSLNSIVEGRSIGAGGGGSFGLECSNGTNYNVALDSGQNLNGNQRRMQNAGEFIAYNLYQDAARTVLWDDGSNGGTVLPGTGSGNDEEIIVYGRVPAQVTPSPGTYLDTVQVTVSW